MFFAKDYWLGSQLEASLVYPQLGCVEGEPSVYGPWVPRCQEPGEGLSWTKKVGARNGVPEEPQPRDGTNSERGIEGEL